MYLLCAPSARQVPRAVPPRPGRRRTSVRRGPWMVAHPLALAACGSAPPCARTGLRQWLQLYGHKNTPLGMTTPEGVMSASHGLRFREALRFVLHAVLHRSGRSSTGCWAHQLDDIYHQILHRQPRRRRLGLQVRDAGAMHGILCPQPSLVTSPTQGTQWGFIRRRRPQHLGRALRQPTTATCPPQAASPPQPSCRASWGNPRELILC